MRVVSVLFAFALAAFAGTACSGGGGGSTKAFCETIHSGDNPLDVFDRYDPTNVTTASEQLQRGVDRMQELERAAPSEIRSDLGVLVDVGSKLVVALDPATGAKPAPDFSGDFQRVQDASSAVTQFASDRCGIDLQAPAAQELQPPAN